MQTAKRVTKVTEVVLTDADLMGAHMHVRKSGCTDIDRNMTEMLTHHERRLSPSLVVRHGLKALCSHDTARHVITSLSSVTITSKVHTFGCLKRAHGDLPLAIRAVHQTVMKR